MSKLVVLQISKNLNKNFWVNLKISSPGKSPFVQVGGNLPLAGNTIEQYKKWQKSYQQLSYFIKFKTRVSTFTNSIGIEIDNYVKRQQQKCYQEFLLLKQSINSWLSDPGFSHITKILKEQLSLKEEILFFISTSCLELRQLPWHLWSIIDDYPAAEIIISQQNELVPNSLSNLARKKLKILAVINNVQEPDLSEYKQELVNRVPSARITFLSQASQQEINSYLRKRTWDILYLNNSNRSAEYKNVFNNNKNSDNINIDSIRYGLKIARDNGLQLAVFNSCDSSEGIDRLEKLKIPDTIIMREVVSERIAHKFFTYFLEDFITNNSLHLSVRSAREKLRKVETIFFDPSWFPVIYQNYSIEISNKLPQKIEEKIEIQPQIEPKIARQNSKAKILASTNGKGQFNYVAIEEKNNLELVNKIPAKITEQIPKNKQLEPEKTTEIIERVPEKVPKEIPKNKQLEPEKTTEIIEREKITAPEKEQKNSKKSNYKSWNKIHLIWLIVLIFVGTKLYTVVMSFILVRFIENSHQNLQTQNANRSPQTALSNPNYQKKYQFKDIKNVPSGIFRYGGSVSWAKIRNKVHPEIRSVWPDFKIVYTEHPSEEGNSDIAIEMLLDFQLSFVQTSRPLKKEEYQEGLDKKLDLEQVPIAIDAIVFGVNPELNISGLTISQIRDIYTGKITNWQQLGGPDLKITPYSKSPSKSGTAEFLKENVLNNAEFAKEVKIVSNITNTLQEVNSDRGAIFYASASHIVGQCSIKPLAIGRRSNNLISPYQAPLIPQEQCPDRRNELDYLAIQSSSYPLSRYLYVIVKKNGSFDRLAGEAYVNLLISEQGQNLIKESGFIPIH